jgi:hypothetical protein
VSWERSGSGSDFDPVCSFCGKKKSDGNRRFIAGPASVYICEECVDLCAEILEEERSQRSGCGMVATSSRSSACRFFDHRMGWCPRQESNLRLAV